MTKVALTNERKNEQHMHNRLPPFPILFVTMLIDIIGFGIVVPVLPFFAEKLGGSFAVGLVLAVFSLGMLVAAPLWGKLSDRFGRRPVLIVALIGNLLAYASLAFSHSLLTLILARGLAGLMSGNFTIVQAYLADITTPAERTGKMGTLGMAYGIGFIIGPALGGLVSHWGLPGLGIAAAVLVAINIIFVIVALPEPTRHIHAPTEGEKWHAAFHRQLIILFGVGLLAMLAFASMQALYALIAQDTLGFGPREVGYVMAYIGVMSIVARVILLGRLTRWLGERMMLIVGSVIIALGLFFLPFAHTLVTFLVVTTLFPFGMSMVNPALMSLVASEASPAKRGLVMGASNTALSAGQVGGPLIAGYLFDTSGGVVAFSVAAAIALAGAVLALAYRPKTSVATVAPTH